MRRHKAVVARRPGVRDDAGSASIWVVGCIALLVLVASVTATRGAAVLARHRAESAADLAALAGAIQIGRSGRVCAAARANAVSNGVALRGCTVSLSPDGRSGTVLARVAVSVRLSFVGHRSVVASARAGRLPAFETRRTQVEQPARVDRRVAAVNSAVACFPSSECGVDPPVSARR